MRSVKLLVAVAAVALGVAAASTPVIAGARAIPRGAVAPAAHRSAQETAVTIVDFDFDPVEITIDVGDTLTWSNAGERPHTATDRGGTFDTQPINPGASASVKLTAPGTYFYFCRINPSTMNGTIVVEPGDEPAPVTRVQAVDPTTLQNEQFRFDPPELEIEAGSSILFANVGGKPHTMTEENGAFSTDIVTPGPEGGRFAGQNVTFSVDDPGEYAFFCEIHPQQMRGSLTVTGQAKAGPDPPANAPESLSVSVVDFAFKEPQASVGPEGEVTYTNDGQANHTATFDDEELDTGQIAPGAKANLKAPAKPGSYSYFCAIHPTRMRGVLVVVGDEKDPTKPAKPPPAAAAAVPGPGGGVSALALATGVIAGFLGGFGIAAFVRRRPST